MPQFHFDFAAPLAKDDTYNFSQDKKKKAVNGRSPLTDPTPASHFARQTLDPKSFANAPHQIPPSKSRMASLSQGPTNSSHLDATLSPSPGPSSLDNNTSKRQREESEGLGIGSMIERMHGVVPGDERPLKKQKVEADLDDAKKANFQGGGKGGELSTYVKEKRKEGIDESGAAPSSIVDLTGGELTLLNPKSDWAYTWHRG